MKPELKNILKNSEIIYITISPTARTDGVIPDKGYAGRTGRIDEVARDLLSLWNPHSLLIAVLLGPPNPPKAIFYKKSWCKLASERQAVGEIRRALQGRNSCLHVESLSPIELAPILARAGFKLALLTEHGSDRLPRRAESIAFLLGSHVDIPGEILARLERYIEIKVSIGPHSYQTSQVIAYLEWEVPRCRSTA